MGSVKTPRAPKARLRRFRAPIRKVCSSFAPGASTLDAMPQLGQSHLIQLGMVLLQEGIYILTVLPGPIHPVEDSGGGYSSKLCCFSGIGTLRQERQRWRNSFHRQSPTSL